MKILLAGDSWGCGEWNHDCSAVLHGGTSQYLTEHGHTVHNISAGGISNLDIVHRIRGFLNRPFVDRPDIIMVFQTEYCRDHKHDVMQKDFGSEDWTHLVCVQDLVDRWTGRFYQRLSEIAVEFSIPVKIIGGCSDTMHFDNMDDDYQGCEMACQSMTGLILTGDPCTENPVFSLYTKNTQSLVEKLRSMAEPALDLQDIMAAIDSGFSRECWMKENPKFFWPDGIHANRIGHRILVDWLHDAGTFS